MADYTQFHLRIYNLQANATAEQQIYRLRAGQTSIGHARACDIWLDDRTVSDRHAQVDYDEAGKRYRLTDLKSINGTRLRGDRLPPDTPVPLRPNATFQIGDYVFVFEEHQVGEVFEAQKEITVEQARDLVFDPYEGEVPPGLSLYSLRLLQYLPEIYQSTADYTQFHLRIYNLQANATAEQQIYRLRAGQTSIGHARACDIWLDDRTVSDRHAQVDYDEAGKRYRLTDLKSINGTRLRGDRLPPDTPVPLRPNATFQIGDYVFVFEEHQVGEVFEAQKEITVVADGAALGDPFDVASGTFLSRFLALFESVLLPLEGLINNFDFYLDARTAPYSFLPWLEYWYALPLGENLTEEQRRQVLLAAHTLFERKGSASALKQMIQLCTGLEPEIDDQTLPGAAFIVKVKAAPDQIDQRLLHHLIVAFKPVDTTYELQIG